jgi:hypothetical protein
MSKKKNNFMHILGDGVLVGESDEQDRQTDRQFQVNRQEDRQRYPSK